MSERALEIADELAKVISTRDDLGDVVEALFDCLAFGLGQLCPECRRSMAAAIAAQLLPAAEKCAADSPDEDEEPLYDLVRTRAGTE